MYIAPDRISQNSRVVDITLGELRADNFSSEVELICYTIAIEFIEVE